MVLVFVDSRCEGIGSRIDGGESEMMDIGATNHQSSNDGECEWSHCLLILRRLRDHITFGVDPNRLDGRGIRHVVVDGDSSTFRLFGSNSR